MMTMRGTSRLIGALFGLALFAAAGPAKATLFMEVGEIGETIGTHQVLPGGTTSIQGFMARTDPSPADLFEFGWGGGFFEVQTAEPTLDTQLFLFDAAGLGITANDDANPPGGFKSRITLANLAPGFYFLAISEWDWDPFSAGGRIFGSGNGNSGPTGPGGAQPLIGWGQYANKVDDTAYTINLNGPTLAVPQNQQIPEPSAFALFAIALGGLGFMARRRVR
ncbi:MAG: DVUA0089 family protein [Pseudomonadota bacterium]